MQTQGEKVKSTEKGPRWESNPQPEPLNLEKLKWLKWPRAEN